MKHLFLTAALFMACAASAQAQINWDVGYDEQPPRPVYADEHPNFYAYNGHDRHNYGYDWGYWKRDQRQVVRADRRDDHHDNGKHYGNDHHKD